MNTLIQGMVDQLTAMERIASTPIPASCPSPARCKFSEALADRIYRRHTSQAMRHSLSLLSAVHPGQRFTVRMHVTLGRRNC